MSRLTADHDALAVQIRTAIAAAIPGPILNAKQAGHTPGADAADNEHTRMELDFGVPRQLGIFGSGSVETAVVTITSWTTNPDSTYREQVTQSARTLARTGISQWSGLYSAPEVNLDPPVDLRFGDWLGRETVLTLTLEVNLDEY